MSLLSINGARAVAVLVILLTTEKAISQNVLSGSRHSANSFKLSTTNTETLWITARHVADRSSIAVGDVRGVMIADGDRVLHGKFEAEGTDDWSAWSTGKTDGDAIAVGDGKPTWILSHRGRQRVVANDRDFNRMLSFTPPPVAGESGCVLLDETDRVIGVVVGTTKEKTPVGLAVPIDVVLEGLESAGVIRRQAVSELSSPSRPAK